MNPEDKERVKAVKISNSLEEIRKALPEGQGDVVVELQRLIVTRLLQHHMNVRTREEKLLAEYPSSSDPDKTYGILMGNDGRVYCECQGWKMRKDCKHLRHFEGR